MIYVLSFTMMSWFFLLVAMIAANIFPESKKKAVLSWVCIVAIPITLLTMVYSTSLI